MDRLCVKICMEPFSTWLFGYDLTHCGLLGDQATLRRRLIFDINTALHNSTLSSTVNRTASFTVRSRLANHYATGANDG